MKQYIIEYKSDYLNQNMVRTQKLKHM